MPMCIHTQRPEEDIACPDLPSFSLTLFRHSVSLNLGLGWQPVSLSHPLCLPLTTLGVLAHRGMPCFFFFFFFRVNAER